MDRVDDEHVIPLTPLRSVHGAHLDPGLLFDLDMNLMRLRERHGETDEAVSLTGTYHNLLRMWADT